MGIDAKLKRYYPLILCVLLAVVAYFQAAGIGQLIASSVAGAPGDGELAVPAVGPLPHPERKSGQPILARNPFDSITGPLDGSAVPEPVEDDEPGEEPSGEALDGDPKCSFGRVMLISATDDPAMSFAAIDDGSGKSGLRRMGDDIQGHTVQAMSWNTVWLAKGAERCQLRLGDEGAAKAAAERPTASPSRAKAPRRGRSRQLAPELAAKITKVSETEYNVERSMVDELLQNQAELMRSARITPSKTGVGVRLSGIRKGSLLDHLGMKNGDSLEAINGFDMGDPQKALEAYGRLRTADKLSVKVNRGGSPVTIDFNIQ